MTVNSEFVISVPFELHSDVTGLIADSVLHCRILFYNLSPWH